MIGQLQKCICINGVNITTSGALLINNGPESTIPYIFICMFVNLESPVFAVDGDGQQC